jgi:DNA-binding response OmpR family regulator
MNVPVNGFEAVRKAKELQPDVILLDVGLPDLNGIEVPVRWTWSNGFRT